MPGMFSEVSPETLQRLFDPKYSQKLNCSLAEHVLRQLAIEVMSRGLPVTEPVEEAFNGPGKCRHGRDTMGTCGECITEAGGDEDTDTELPTEEILYGFCDAYVHGEAFPRRTLFEALKAMGYVRRKRDLNHDQAAVCHCGHTYDRHFDPFENDREVGCKYCGCPEFKKPEPGGEGI